MSKDLSGLRIDKSQIDYKRAGSRRAVTVISIAVSLGLLIFAYIFLYSPSHTVETTTVSLYYPSQSLTLLNASGYVTASRKASVAPKVTGMLVELNTEEGSRVRKGDILARLENDDLQAARAQAQANLEAAMQNIESARAELYDAKANHRRKSELLAEAIVPKADYDLAENRLKRAEAAVRAAEASAEAARAALRAAEVAMQYTYIRAPFDGVVLTKNADVGDIVTPFGAATGLKAAVVTIADMNSLLIEADVSESNLHKIKVGQPCEIVLDALPDKRFDGIIHSIVPTADRTKASVLVKVRFKELDPSILPDMSVKVNFLTRPLSKEDKNPVTTVNKKALLKDANYVKAIKVKDGKAVEVSVKTGRDLGDLVEVIEGLKPGDIVLLRPTAKIKSGDTVKVKGQ